MLTLTACSFTMKSRNGSPGGGFVNSAAVMHELEEITTFIEFSQIVARSNFAERLGLPPSSKAADLRAVMQTDECLNKLETSHTSLLSESGLTNVNNSLSRERFLFQLRWVETVVHGRDQETSNIASE